MQRPHIVHQQSSEYDRNNHTIKIDLRQNPHNPIQLRSAKEKNTGGTDFVGRNRPQNHDLRERRKGVSNLGIETLHNFAGLPRGV